MARKNEFKPDKRPSPLLKKLHLSPKQRRSVLKWVLYSLLLLALSVLQDVLLCRVHLWGATTDLVPCGIFLICLLAGAQSGSVFALIASVLYLFSGTAPGNYCILFITVLSVLVTIFRQSYLQKSFAVAFLCCGVCILLYELLVGIFGIFLGLTVSSRLGVFILTGVLSLAAVPILYPVVSAIGRIGGEAWKD